MTNFSTMNKGNDVYINETTSISRPHLVRLGNHIGIDFGFVCTTKLDIGDYVHISPHVSVIGGARASLVVEDFCFISTGARMICGSDLFQEMDSLVQSFQNSIKTKELRNRLY